MEFLPTCPRCADRLAAGVERCPSCGALSGAVRPGALQREGARRRIPEPVAPAAVTVAPPSARDRYGVTELEGYADLASRHATFTAYVVDRAVGFGVVASFSHELRGAPAYAERWREYVRSRARERADLFNALDRIAREAAA